MKIDERFQILDKIGSGSFATVYRARDRELGREVAIKQIHQQYLEDPQLLDRYWSEAQLLASLQHPNIVTIFDVHRDRGWLIMELMQANLRDRLQGRQMDLKSLKTTVAHSLRALKYLHSRGIIHGDIKPSNLMIDSRRRVKLGDFGLARRVSDEDGSLIKGTTKYMAPEVVSDEFGDVGPQSDLYSLGFSAYELMCGSDHFENLFPGLSAFGRDKQAAWMMWHAAPDRRLPQIERVLEGVPADLTKVIEKLTEKEPAQRYQSADDALSDLKIDLKIVKTGEETVSDADEPPDPDRKRRLILIGAFACSMLLSLAILFMPSGEKPGPPQAQNTVGIVRSIDASSGTLVYEDPVEGLPHKLALGTNTRIKLVRPGEQPMFILPEEIEPGQWLEIEESRNDESGGARLALTVSPPVESTGVIESIDTAEGCIVVDIADGRVRNTLDLFIPPRTRIQLNDRPARLHELHIDDRVNLSHLLDPTGRRGHIAASLQAWRRQELVAFVDQVDIDAQELSVHMGRPDGQLRRFQILADTTLVSSTAVPLQWDDLAPGDRIRLIGDTRVYHIVVSRDQQRIDGVLTKMDVDAGRISVKVNRPLREVELAVLPTTQIMLGQSSANLEDLRTEFDRLTVHYQQEGDDLPQTTTIDAVRPERHDRWAAVIGTGGYIDRSISTPPHATKDAELLRTVLVSRYALDPDWTLLLSDENVQTIRRELKDELARVPRDTQMIVALFGQAYLGDDGKVWLAFRDFNLDDMPAAGMPLDELLRMMNDARGNRKILLLDVAYARSSRERSHQPSIPEMLSRVEDSLSDVTIIAASSEGQTSNAWPDKRHGVFAWFLAEAFRGAADADRNLEITPDELYTFLEREMPQADLPQNAEQTPYRLQP